ncbi:NAD-dependent protein deacetylase Sirt2 [Schistosoma japonicum]|uniref:NAD-dependent protein deacetylase n=1 Tax=Schistosoma japonicum TaxID=6182 RepID=C1LH16_SCHJA|nr:NAD-dependent protein deacetylase Sirt2 [Schistosoma japonicum]CAX73994.1 NAD-dependent deacetylase sirtuin-2 [Schistosoma japonicum]
MSFNFDRLKKTLFGGDKCPPKLKSFDIEGVSQLIQDGKINKIVTMVGAGISTAAGIPDFRSPSSGVYDNLEEFNLPTPTTIFSIEYFQHDPRPFFEIARRLYRPEAKPTLAHYFIKLLHDKGLLLRHYTQNVDSLERLSGLPEEKLIEAHGTFYTGHCIKCNKQYDFDFMLNDIMAKRVPRCPECQNVVKPDVVLFGESMPKKFFKNLTSDLSNCDLLIIMGTSLTVLPFCAMIHRVGCDVPRLYINREYNNGSSESSYLKWGEPGNKRDVFWSGNTDDGVVKISELVGWKDDLLKLKEETDSRLIAQFVEKKSQQ